MNNTEILKLLEDLAKKLDIKLKYVILMPKYSSGGLCKVEDELHIYIDSKLRLEDKLDLLIKSLSKVDFDKSLIDPELQKIFEIKV